VSDPGTLLELRPEHAEPFSSRFSGRCIAGMSVPGSPERIFGGHALAQALVAASRTAGDRNPPNSLHAYFVGPGRPDADIDYECDVLKSGRSLDLVSVRGRQFDRTVLALTASFHALEPSSEYQEGIPDVPPPASLDTVDYIPPRTNPAVRAPFEIRYAGGGYRDSDPAEPEPRADVWIRTRHAVASAAPLDHAALLAYAVDFLMTRAAHMPLRRNGRRLNGASLDHAMWFHRPFRVDEWLLVSSRGVRFSGSRALTACRVFDEAGSLVASAGQEALLRPPSA
jgi:acyl-CoA thioesterase-2